ncbi:MAG: restriction endonuclease subunit S [Methylobacter sp.]
MELNEASAKYLPDEKLQVPAGYKQTELGMMPEDWSLIKLKEVSIISRLAGAEYTTMWQETLNGEIIALRGFNIGKGRIIDKDLSRISNELSLRLKRSRLSKGDVVYPCVGSIGNAVVITENDKFHIQQNIARITPNPKAINSGFLASYLMSFLGELEVSRFNASSSQPSVLVGSLREYRIPLPPTLAEQEAIAEALSDADALIEALEQLIAKKRQLKQGAMQELLHPKLSDSIQLLKDVSSLKGRIGWQGLKQTEFTSNEDEPFLITGMNFKDGAIRWHEVYHISESRYEIAKDIQLKPDDVLMTKDGTIGKVLYIDAIPYPYKASLNSHLLLFRPIRKSYIPKYLYYQLSSKRFKNFIELSKSGTTFFGLSQAAVGNYPVVLPPIDEQKRIAQILSDMDAEIAELENKLAKARAVKQGMMQQLLTGRIRLIGTSIPTGKVM